MDNTKQQDSSGRSPEISYEELQIMQQRTLAEQMEMEDYIKLSWKYVLDELERRQKLEK